MAKGVFGYFHNDQSHQIVIMLIIMHLRLKKTSACHTLSHFVTLCHTLTHFVTLVTLVRATILIMLIKMLLRLENQSLSCALVATTIQLGTMTNKVKA